MPSNTNYDTALKKVQYTKDHFDKYKRDLKAAFRLHADKLDTVMLSGTMNPVVKRTLWDKYTAIRKDDGAARLLTDDQVDARIAEDLDEFKKEVAAAIILTIPDETLALQSGLDARGRGQSWRLILRPLHAQQRTF